MTEKINAAIVGLGGMGQVHIQAAVDSPFVDKVYGVDYSPEETEKRCAKANILPADWKSVLADPTVKIICIASPNACHVPQAKEALLAGKAVLCEKPMGDTLEEAKELLDVKNAVNGFLQIGFELHYSKLYTKTKEWIDSGLIGTPLNIQCRYFCCAPKNNGTWRLNGEGNFLIGEKLSHYLDLQRWWFGTKVKSVYAQSSPNAVPYFHHKDNHQIMTTFEGGGLGILNFIMYFGESYHEDPTRELLEKQSEDGHFLQYHITGTGGCIESDVFKRTLKRWPFTELPGNLENTIVEKITWKPEEDLRYFHNVYDQNLCVLERVAKGLPPEVPAEDAFETMKLCFAAGESTDSGKLINF
ncbi:MAG: Gfo/Idh/MocA family oxidoreductase [Lentisphaeria bacterium]|nr:Gfo/Idh/MocA family oxidoreductase [Lentisphaeria bacterium]